MLVMIAALLGYLLVVMIIVAAAWRWGGPTERLVSTIWLIGAVASQVASLHGTAFRTIEVPLAAVDVILLVALLVAAHRSVRFWPIWATAFHLVGTVTHLAPVMVPGLLPNIYAIVQPMWGYPVLIVIAIGILRHNRTTAVSKSDCT